MKYVYHVRLRDTTKDQLQVRVGQGEVEYGRLVNQLNKVRYDRALCVDILPMPDVDQAGRDAQDAAAAGEPAVAGPTGLRRFVLTLILLRKVRGKWGLAPWRKPVWHKQKRCRHGACPLFPQASPWSVEKGDRHRRRRPLFCRQSLIEATEPVPIFDCRS